MSARWQNRKSQPSVAHRNPKLTTEQQSRDSPAGFEEDAMLWSPVAETSGQFRGAQSNPYQ